METVYIRLEKPPAGSNHASTVEGRAAAKNWEKLKLFARELNAKPLDDFLANKESDAAWYAPAPALETLQQLISRLSSDKRGIENVRHLIRDLNSYENILSSAKARGSKFRFSTRQDE